MTAQPKHLSLAFEHQKDMKCEILLGDTWGGGVGEKTRVAYHLHKPSGWKSYA